MVARTVVAFDARNEIMCSVVVGESIADEHGLEATKRLSAEMRRP